MFVINYCCCETYMGKKKVLKKRSASFNKRMVGIAFIILIVSGIIVKRITSFENIIRIVQPIQAANSSPEGVGWAHG